MELKTLTGKDLFEAFRELDRQLPPHAYKKIEGGKGGRLGLTDIIPAFLPDLLMELFGPIGFGWGYNLDSMESTSKTVERSKGYTEDEVTAICKLSIWYRFLHDGETVVSDPVPATGGSTNTLVEWAMKGALTNALGCAWFFAGYQLSVYKNERSHNGDKPPAGQGQKGQQEQKSQSAGKQPQQQPPSNGHAQWNAAMGRIERLILDLKLPREKYWRYATAKYAAARDNLTIQQLNEQIVILSQCGKKSEKLEEFKKLLNSPSKAPEQQPVGSDNQQGAMH